VTGVTIRNNGKKNSPITACTRNVPIWLTAFSRSELAPNLAMENKMPIPKLAAVNDTDRLEYLDRAYIPTPYTYVANVIQISLTTGCPIFPKSSNIA